jgi:4,5-DOPA dioxygenase extradiol
LNAFKPFDYHLELGRSLRELRDSDVLVIGSGNVVHNLEAVDRNRRVEAFAWAHRSDDAARQVLESKTPTEVAALDAHPDFGSAVPTPDHYLPLLYLAGMAGDEPMSLFVDGHQGGSVSMAAYAIGMSATGGSDR